MKYRDKERIVNRIVKSKAKEIGWRFKGYFIHKVINSQFCIVNFYLSRKEDLIHGWSSIKPYEIDNLFWEIIDEIPNKKMPQSFRAEAAFCVRATKISEFNKVIKFDLEPIEQLSKLVIQESKILSQVALKTDKIDDYLNLALTDEKMNSVGIVTGLILNGKYDDAINKMTEYRNNQILSGFKFGKYDYYDLAEEYINQMK